MDRNTENEMQAAGRQSSHEFLDFRSARRAYQRSRRYGRKGPGRYHCLCCNRSAMRLHKKEESSHIMQQRPWDDDFGAELDWDESMEFMNEATHMATFGNLSKRAQRLMAEEGEDFGAWGRRRIEEMRRVKEERIRKQQGKDKPAAVSPSLVSGLCQYSSIPTTTLPTDPFDIHGHNLLRSVLTPNKFMSNWLRSQGKPFHTICGFEWFGEYSWAWAWHRNASGFWEIGYEQCGSETFPCSCCGTGMDSCFCEEFVGIAAPDETQRCSLVEWAHGRLRDILEEAHAEELNEVKDFEVLNEEVPEAWEVMSDAASMEWSVLSADEEFESI